MDNTEAIQPKANHFQEDKAQTGSRALIAATLATTVLFVAAQAALGTPPAAAESGAQVIAWLREHGQAVRWYVWMTTVGTPPFVLMFVLLYRILPAPHREMFLLGGFIIVLTTAVQAWTWGGLVLHANQLDPAIARAIVDVAIFWGPVLTGATTTMIAPVALLALRRRAGLPLWVGVLGLAAFTEQCIETVTIFGSTGFTQPGGAMNLQLGAGLTAAWTLAFAFWGGLRGRAQENTAQVYAPLGA
jgi:hypothetical protein